ncbi:MAG: tail fiber domain-containing protein, partial [Firmicutes bacterium]|nr:tail fiber domain-containing protein [Bacillota bacterium]
STTHKIAKASASRCRCAYLILQGFNFTSTAAESKVTISECGGVGHIDLRYLHINGGTPATAKTVGFHILRTSTTIWCRDVTVSNQHRAVTLEECDGFRPYRMDGKTNQGYYSLTASAVFEGSANTLQFTGSKVNTNATQSAFIVADNKGFEFTQPARDNAINLGSSTLRYKQVYAATPSISTSDAREKEEITPLDAAAMTQFLMDLQPVSYKFKGNEYLRTHFGLLAQDVNAAMQKNRMNSLDFAGYINSPVLDENRQIIGETFGLRYEEFIPLILAVLQAQQRKIDLLVQQADELEARKI